MLKHQGKEILNYWNLDIFQETLEGHVSSVKCAQQEAATSAFFSHCPQLGMSVLLLHHSPVQ